MPGLFNRKKVITPQGAATEFIVAMVKECEEKYEEWRKEFISGIDDSGWLSNIPPDEIDKISLQWMLIAGVMAQECLAIKNIFDARISRHLYDAVYIEIGKFAKVSGIDKYEDVVFELLAQSERDIESASLMPHDSITGNIISYFGFKPSKEDSKYFPPISLMLISTPLMYMGAGYWKWINNSFRVKC
jgi:hypothetical protein